MMSGEDLSIIKTAKMSTFNPMSCGVCGTNANYLIMSIPGDYNTVEFKLCMLDTVLTIERHFFMCEKCLSLVSRCTSSLRLLHSTRALTEFQVRGCFLCGTKKLLNRFRLKSDVGRLMVLLRINRQYNFRTEMVHRICSDCEKLYTNLGELYNIIRCNPKYKGDAVFTEYTERPKHNKYDRRSKTMLAKLRFSHMSKSQPKKRFSSRRKKRVVRDLSSAMHNSKPKVYKEPPKVNNVPPPPRINSLPRHVFQRKRRTITPERLHSIIEDKKSESKDQIMTRPKSSTCSNPKFFDQKEFEIRLGQDLKDKLEASFNTDVELLKKNRKDVEVEPEQTSTNKTELFNRSDYVRRCSLRRQMLRKFDGHDLETIISGHILIPSCNQNRYYRETQPTTSEEECRQKEPEEMEVVGNYKDSSKGNIRNQTKATKTFKKETSSQRNSSTDRYTRNSKATGKKLCLHAKKSLTNIASNTKTITKKPPIKPNIGKSVTKTDVKPKEMEVVGNCKDSSKGNIRNQTKATKTFKAETSSQRNSITDRHTLKSKATGKKLCLHAKKSLTNLAGNTKTFTKKPPIKPNIGKSVTKTDVKPKGNVGWAAKHHLHRDSQTDAFRLHADICSMHCQV